MSFRFVINEAVSDLKIILADTRDFYERMDNATDDVRLVELKQLIEICESDANEINAKLEQISNTRLSWAEASRRLTATARANADFEMEKFEEEIDTETITRAKVRVRELTQIRFKLKIEFEQVRGQMPVVSPPQPQSSKRDGIKLPTLQLDKFDGDRLKWTTFYENFKTAVHDTNMSSVQKMTYLRTSLIGEAKMVIDGLTMSEANYDIAMGLLEERYNNKHEIIRQLYNEITNLKPCRTFEDCKEFSNKLECLCRQLEAHGEQVESPLVYLSLEQKLSRPMLREILHAKEKQTNWNTTSFRRKLREHVKKEEELQQILRAGQSEDSRTYRADPKGNNRAYANNNASQTSQRHDYRFNHRTNPHPRGNQNGAPESSITFTAPQSTMMPQCPKNLFNKSNPSATKTIVGKCRLCGREHWADQCTVFKTLQSRIEKVKEKRLCARCLNLKHTTQTCTKVCWYCKKDHHQSICPQKFGLPVETNVSSTATSPKLSTKVLLLTATAILKNPVDPKLTKRVIFFFDTGSHRSYLTRELAERLSLRVEGEDTMNICTFGASEPKEYHTQRVSAEVDLGTEQMPIQLRIIDSIVPVAIPIVTINDQKFDEQALQTSINECCPDVLIGMDYMHRFKIRERKVFENGLVLSDSIIGPMLSGMSLEETPNGPSTSLLSVGIMHSQARQTDKLFDIVQEHFDFEKAGLDNEDESNENEKVLKEFVNTMKLVDGRYEVSLPWKTPMPELDSNYGLALGRLRNTMKKLKQRPELLIQYHKTMTDQLEKEIIEPVKDDEPDPDTIVHYLPHQAVIREDKIHTKLRVVYDGSAKTRKDGHSINQCLHRGPLLLGDLVGILIRTRLPKVCIVADIEKAFLQLSIAPKDRDACRFLWPTDPFADNWEANLTKYRFRRVTFGLNCSPFLLAATVKEHLRRENSELSKMMLENVYVDNIFLHLSSTEDTLKTCKEAKEVFARAAMNLREFASNDRESIAKLDPSDQIPLSKLKILGLTWDTEADVFCVCHKIETDKTVSKRTVLKNIASAFDPLGWMTPALLSAKRFFQRLWKEKLDWDDELSDEWTEEWRNIGSHWNQEIMIPRRMFKTNEELILHIFADASKDAFGAVAYLQTKHAEDPQSRMIYSKCRVKALKSKTTIPRLELQALKLAAQIANFLRVQIKVSQTRLWTDSQCTIHWLKATSKLDRFIQNRVTIIRKYKVNFVSTNDNPADLITRGANFRELGASEKWWLGPTWLRTGRESPQEGPSYDPVEYEQRKGTEEPIHIASTTIEIIKESVIDPMRISTWTKAVRVTAYVLRFRNNLKRKNLMKDKNLTGSEIKRARVFLIREAQEREPPTDDALRNLEMFRDDENLWRCRGRIDNGTEFEDTKHPIWLPKTDRITELIVLNSHIQTFHSGSTTTLAHLRRQFWLPQGRRRIRTVIRSQCLKCRRHLVAPYKLPKMPNLPAERVRPSRPFEHTGLDYFGPINVRRSQDSEASKVWVCIFTCFVTRAIHLEIANDMSAEAFLLTFRRFIARRGAPKSIMSDNGTNFKLASKVVTNSWKDVITGRSTQEAAAEHGITWKFIAERAPWRGGFWERLIGIIKNAMKKTIGRKLLVLEEFYTLLTEIEMIVNHRPITYQSEDEVMRALRPIDFLIPYDLTCEGPTADEDDREDPTYYDQITQKDTLIKNFQITLRKVEKFWNLWSTEYLLSLRERQKTLDFKQGSTSKSIPSVGEVVLIQENETPRNQWKLAVIQELLIGTDGQIRTARVKGSGRTIIRAINSLCPMEVRDQEIDAHSDASNSEKIDKILEPQICEFSSQKSARQKLDCINSLSICVDSFSMSDDTIYLNLDSEEEDESEEEDDHGTLGPAEPETTVPRTKYGTGSLGRSNQAATPTHTRDRRRSNNARSDGKATLHKILGREQAPMSKARPGPVIQSNKSKIEKKNDPKIIVTIPGDHSLTDQAPKLKSISITINNTQQAQGNARYERTSICSVTDASNTGWELGKTCDHHENCPGLSVTDVIRLINADQVEQIITTNMNQTIPSLFHAFFVFWALRQQKPKNTGQEMAHYLSEICKEPFTSVAIVHDRLWDTIVNKKLQKKNNVRVSAKWFNNRDVRPVLDLWENACHTAKESFKRDTLRPFRFAELMFKAEDDDSKTYLKGFGIQVARVLTLRRQARFHPETTMVQASYVLVGDDLINGARPYFKGVNVMHAETKATCEVIKSLYFQSTTHTVVLCTGLSVLRREHTVQTYHKCLKDVQELANKFKHLRWVVIPPPERDDDKDRNRRIAKIVNLKWKAVEILKAPGGGNVWEREFQSKREYPTAEDYEHVIEALYKSGVTVPLQPPNLLPATTSTAMNPPREDLNARLKRLLPTVTSVLAEAGSVANSAKEKNKI